MISLRTPVGPIAVKLHCRDDTQTVNEIFFRGDYIVPGENNIIVDFGSNIGISTLYFLSRNNQSRCFCFEPLPQNILRLEENLVEFARRYELNPVAVGERNGRVQFGWEPTGRYGGVGRDTGQWLDVDCVDSNEQLARILGKHGRIDVLKVDIETLEEVVITRIPRSVAEQIGKIIVEYPFESNPLGGTHEMHRNNRITTFIARGIR